jgi:hypothetical protein
LDEKAFVEQVTCDLDFAASVCEGLMRKPKALRQLIAYREVTEKLIKDPVFFAVLMCGDKWLVRAPEHQKLLRDLSSKQVAVCGRGWGKSRVFSRKNLWLLYTKQKVESLIVSSTQRQSMIMFDYCYSTVMANPLLSEMVQRPGTNRTTIKLKPPLSGKVIALPCSNDKLRGYHPDYIFIDEASIVPSEMITSVIMPMLTKADTSIIMSGTPMSIDHIFRKAFLDSKRYSVHHYASYQSPLVSRLMLDEWKEVMTQEEWQREVEGLWVESTCSFFPMNLIIGCIDATLSDPALPNSYVENIENIGHPLRGYYFGGLDLGKQVDYSVLFVVERLPGGEIATVHKRQLPLGTSYPEVIGYVARANQVFHLENLYVDKGGIGDAVVDELHSIQICGVQGVFFTDKEKENMLNNLKLLMEKKMLKLSADDKALIAQINEQQYEYLQPKTAQERIHLKFWHPVGRHDDQLMALALACQAASQAAPPGLGVRVGR